MIVCCPVCKRHLTLTNDEDIYCPCGWDGAWQPDPEQERPDEPGDSLSLREAH